MTIQRKFRVAKDFQFDLLDHLRLRPRQLVAGEEKKYWYDMIWYDMIWYMLMIYDLWFMIYDNDW